MRPIYSPLIHYLELIRGVHAPDLFYQKCRDFKMNSANFSICASTIYVTGNELFDDSTSNQIFKDMARYFIKAIFKPLRGIIR